MPALSSATHPVSLSASRSPVASASPAPPATTDSVVAAERRAAVALAEQLFGHPEPMVLLRHEGALRILGWILGRGRAECCQAGQLAHIVGIDVILIGDGLYAVAERTATDTQDGLSRLDARCVMFESAEAARRHCEDAAGDQTRRAARVAALDHAIRRWPPLRGVSATERLVRVPFQLD